MTEKTVYPLTGVTVLDLSRVLAGPWATQMLADLGARVIKIERPGVGDDTRGWGPPFAKDSQGNTTDAAYYMAANHNKESVAVNIATEKGADIIRALATKSDILVENFKPGGLKRYGLDFETIQKSNARLVYCSISGFGQTGPERDRPGYDYMIQAQGGMMSVTGPPEEPMKAGLATADLFTGMYASSAILAALRHAEATGEGQHLDVALFDCQLAILANQSASYLVGGEIPQRMGNAHASIVPYQVFATADGHIVLAVGNDEQFIRFCRAAEATPLSEDKRFQKNRDRVENRRTLVPIIADILKQHPSAFWLKKLEAHNVPAGPINNVADALNEPQATARGMLHQAQREGEPPYSYVTHPVKYSATPAKPPAAPPKVGDDTERVLKEALGMDAAEITALRAQGVVG